MTAAELAAMDRVSAGLREFVIAKARLDLEVSEMYAGFDGLLEALGDDADAAGIVLAAMQPIGDVLGRLGVEREVF